MTRSARSGSRGRPGPRRFASPRLGSLAIGASASLLVHGGVALVLVSLPAAPDVAIVINAVPVPDDALDLAIDVEAPSAPGEERRARAELRTGGADSIQNVDSIRNGQGGDARGAPVVMLLMPYADTVTLVDGPLDNVARSQQQRIRTSDERASRDTRRATPSPSDEPFLASGPGEHRERRPVSPLDATDGARTAPLASRAGSATSHEPGTSEDARHARGEGAAARGALPSIAGSAIASPGEGIAGGEGRAARAEADVAHGRPRVDEGRASTTAELVDGHIQDDRDSERLASELVQSWVDSTERAGRERGRGRGGEGGGGSPGSGGDVVEGGRARAYAPGDGPFDALDTEDRRYMRWFLEQRRRIGERLEFPHERALALDQGETVYVVRVRRDGTLAQAPMLRRSSGFGDFDAAARAAIETAAPFGPIPAEVAPSHDVLAVTMAIAFSNPVVR